MVDKMKKNIKTIIFLMILIILTLGGFNYTKAYVTGSEDGNYTQEEIYVEDVDFIEPDFTYKYITSDIDHGTKTVKMTFDVTDKYYDIDQPLLTLNDMTIMMKVSDSRYDNLSTISRSG